MTWEVILELGKYAAAIAAILALAGMVFNKLVYKPLVKLIKEQTYPLQPNSNGGKSLPDVAKKINYLDKRIDSLEESHDEIKETLNSILELVTKPKPRTRKTDPTE
jgi:predicted transcriptional regulator